MSSLQTLPPDQRAVLQLLLQKDRSYDEIAQLLRLDGQTIRTRAHHAVFTLGPDAPGLSEDQRGELTDFLLGEQTASSRAATRAFLEGSPAARAWARGAVEELRPLGGDRLPEIPAEPAGASAPVPEPEPLPVEPPPALVLPSAAPGLPPEAQVSEAPEPVDESAVREPEPLFDDEQRRGPRIGGMLLVFAVAAVIAVVFIVGLRALTGGDDEGDSPVSQSTTPSGVAPTEPTGAETTETTSTTPKVNAEIRMRPPAGGGSARATVTLITQAGKEAIALAGQGLQPTTSKAFYGLWFANSEQDAVFLGYAPQVGENGRMRLFDSLPKDLDPTEYRQIWLTREVVTQDTTTPITPGTVALTGDIGG